MTSQATKSQIKTIKSSDKSLKETKNLPSVKCQFCPKSFTCISANTGINFKLMLYKYWPTHTQLVVEELHSQGVGERGAHQGYNGIFGTLRRSPQWGKNEFLCKQQASLVQIKLEMCTIVGLIYPQLLLTFVIHKSQLHCDSSMGLQVSTVFEHC